MKRKAFDVMRARFPWKKQDWTTNVAVRIANNIAFCSCTSCGNPRRHFKYETRAEMKFKMSAREQMRDWLDDHC